MTKDDQVSSAFDEIDATWGQVHALINAVGPSEVGRFEDLSDEAWLRSFDQGVLTAVRCIRHSLPLLRQASGDGSSTSPRSPCNTRTPGSSGTRRARRRSPASRRTWPGAWLPTAILVNAVAPGPVLTAPIRAAVRAANGDPDDPYDAFRVMSEEYGSAVDLRRIADPAEVAEVVAFCASAANTYMTGAHLNVDGGSDFT